MTTPENTTVPTPSARWVTIITAFAAGIGAAPDAVTAKLLSEAVSSPDDAGLAVLADPGNVSDTLWEDLFPRAEFAGAKKPALRAAVRVLRAAISPAAPVLDTAPAPHATPATAPPVMIRASLLPTLPGDRGALEKLIIGGVLADGIGPADGATAAMVAMADSVGLYSLPDQIVGRIEEYCEESKRPPTRTVYSIIKEIKRRRYAEILEVLDVDSSVVSDKNRKVVMQRMRDIFWPALRRHFDLIHGWFETNKAAGFDPTAMLGMMSAMMTGNAAMAQAYVQPTDTSLLRAAGTDLIEAVNGLYAGLYSLPVIRALAGDAMRITAYLDPGGDKFATILANTGKGNREDLLRSLGTGVTDAYVRAQNAVMQYVFAAVSMRDTSDADLALYATQLHSLGMQIPWADLGRPSISGGGTPGLPPGSGRKSAARDGGFDGRAPTAVNEWGVPPKS